MGRKVKKVEIKEEDYKTLKMWERSLKAEKRYSQRAKVILLSGEGKSLKEISKIVGLSWQNCLKWRKRFEGEGINGLRDRERSGRPLKIKGELRAKVISLACSPPPKGKTVWSVRDLAKAIGIGASSVHRILNEGKIKPHKVKYWCGRSNDPEFEKKQAQIVGLYLNPPENALVLAVDEKSQIQALDRTQPMLPMKEGYEKRLTFTYKRHGTTCLLAALAVHDGKVEGRCIDSQNHKEFLAFLKHLYRKYPRKELHIIVDNLSAHKHKEVMSWVKKRRRLHLYFTPTYSSWLNQIEIWFNIFSRDVLKGGVWHSKRELVNQIMDYIKYYNENKAKPFKWTYTGKPLAV